MQQTFLYCTKCNAQLLDYYVGHEDWCDQIFDPPSEKCFVEDDLFMCEDCKEYFPLKFYGQHIQFYHAQEPQQQGQDLLPNEAPKPPQARNFNLFDIFQKMQQEQEQTLQQQEELMIKVKQSPLPAYLFNKLPQIRYKHSENYDEENKKCFVCQEYFDKDNTLLLLPCTHRYHVYCIRPWLVDHTDSCPICKTKVTLK